MKLKWTLLLGALLPFALTAMEIEAETGKMSAGEQTIRFWSREPNLEIDKVIIEEVK